MQKERQAYTVGITPEAWKQAKEIQQLVQTATGYKISINSIISQAVKKYYKDTTEIYTKLAEQ